MFLQKFTLQIGLKKLKILCRGHILVEKKLLELFMKKNCEKQIEKEIKTEIAIKRKGNKSNGNDKIMCLIAGEIKKG